MLRSGVYWIYNIHSSPVICSVLGYQELVLEKGVDKMKVDLFIYSIPIRQTETKPEKYKLSLKVVGEKEDIVKVWEQILELPAFATRKQETVEWSVRDWEKRTLLQRSGLKGGFGMYQKPVVSEKTTPSVVVRCVKTKDGQLLQRKQNAQQCKNVKHQG